MAVELCSEISGGGGSSLGMSPRISFSQDFCQTDGVHVDQRNRLSNSSSFLSSSTLESSSLDFDFCVRESFDRESSSADELFSDGKILPFQIKKKDAPLPKLPQIIDQSKHPPHQQLPLLDHSNNSYRNLKRESAKEIYKTAINDSYEKQNSKSFWSFKRSSSLKLPILLSRSNSTGSDASVKRLQSHKDNHKHNSLKHSPVTNSTMPPPPMKQSSYSTSHHHQKPPLKKGYGSLFSQNPNGGGVRVSPVLNVAPSTIFGFGSFFIAKDKSKKKW